MEKSEIIVLSEVLDKLENLEQVLFEKEYFGFLESSIDYVREIKNAILEIPHRKHFKSKNP